MKPATKKPSRALNPLLQWSGLMVLTVLVMMLSGCEPSGSGEGVDPGIVQIPLAYINRPIPTNNQGNPIQTDLREPLLFSEGGDVFLRSNSTVSGSTINITGSVTGGTGDVKGLNTSFDGSKLIFSLRLLESDNGEPTWNIYEYDIEQATLKPIISNFIIADEGDDLFPAYLADGRIVFSSSRQRQSREMLVNELKPGFSALDEDRDTVALVLHVMNSDGTDIHQISFNQSHDLHPQMLSNSFDGQIVFSRWDNAGRNSEVNLYKMNPDGSKLELLYGARSHATGTGGARVQFTGVREMLNGNLMIVAKPFRGTFDGGNILIIDAERFVDIDKPIWPQVGLSGPAQTAATVTNATTDGSISLDGRYNSAFPLWDGSERILVSKSSCQLRIEEEFHPCIEPFISDPEAEEASPPYTIWIYDMNLDTEKVVVLAETGRMITEAISLPDRPLPNIIFDKGSAELDSGWQSESVGVVNIKSVYDMADNTFSGCFFNLCTSANNINSVQDFADPLNATAAQRPARFVRFVKAVGIPDPDDPNLVNPPDLANAAYGPTRDYGMREIVGYAPVEPDGSVMVKVPADVPLAVEVLDSEGRRIGPRHANWFQVQPGDTLNCTGCHDLSNGAASAEVHSRADGHAPSINSGLPLTLLYANTLIPGTTTPNPYYGNQGETMAEIRFDRVSLTIPPAVQPQLSTDLIYADYWTDPAVRAPDASYSFLYANLDLLIPSPLNSGSFCVPWSFNCRAVINYPQQIHPLWQLDRGVDVSANGIGDDTCIECHTTSDAMGNDRLAAAQLDLTDGASDQEADQFKSYRELLFNDQGETLNAGGQLIDIEIMVPDGNGGFDLVPDPAFAVNPSMDENGARSSYFIEKMTETELDASASLSSAASDPTYVDHSSMLSGDELRLIGEWLDLGAQNFNNPFDPAAPQD